MLVQARTSDPDAFERSEAVLVQAACIHSVSGLSRVVGHWREAVAAQAGADTEAELRARRRLHASATFAGMVRVDGDLDPETGEVLLTALGAVVDAEARSREEDERSPAQRRADALGEVCRQWLDLAPRPAVATERPHLTLTVSAEALAGSVERGAPGPEVEAEESSGACVQAVAEPRACVQTEVSPPVRSSIMWVRSPSRPHDGFPVMPR